jgi:hypothetical protein
VDFPAKRRVLPGTRLGLHHIEVSRQKEGSKLTGTAETCNDVSTAGCALQNRRLKTCSAKLVGQELRCWKLVTRRVGRIDSEERLAEPKRVLRQIQVTVGHFVLPRFTRKRRRA